MYPGPASSVSPTPPPPAPSSLAAPVVPPSRRPRTGAYAAVGVLVVIVVVLVVLVGTGVLPWFRSTPSGSGEFAAERGAAQQTANGEAGGPWSPIFALGLAPAATVQDQVNETVGSLSSFTGDCNFVASGPSSLTIPGTSNVSAGRATDWVFVFRGASGSFLVTSGVDSSVTIVGTLSGSACQPAGGVGSIAALPGTMIDSTAAAAAANSVGGYAYLHSHPAANATFLASGGFSAFTFSTGAFWVVSYSTCAVTGAAAGNAYSGSDFIAIVNATAGTVIQTTQNATTCPGAGPQTPLGTVLALGTVNEAVAGPNHWYNVSVVSAGDGLALNNLTFEFQTSTGGTVVLALPAVSVIGLAGATVATYSMATATWTSGGTTLVSNQQTIIFETTTALSGVGDSLVVVGSGAFTGTVTAAIP